MLIHNVSDTYLLEEENEKFIFKIYRDQHRKRTEIKAEVELLNRLKQHQISVAFPLTAPDGSQIQRFEAAEGIRYGVLFSYAKGNPVYTMTDNQLAIVGKEMARFHQVSSSIQLSNDRKSYDWNTMVTQPLEIIKPAFKDLENEYQYLINASKRVLSQAATFNETRFSYGYCHYDFLPKNFHFDDQDRLTFFDFDFVGKGYLVNDIASFYIHFFLEVFLGKITQEEANRSFDIFIKSYRTVKALSNEELNAIPRFGFAFWIFYLGFQYENVEDCFTHFFGPKYLKDRVSLIKTWVDSHIDHSFEELIGLAPSL